MASQSNELRGHATEESTPLLTSEHPGLEYGNVRRRNYAHAIRSLLSRDELALGGTATGERIPYNAYTTIDWLHDLVSFYANPIFAALQLAICGSV
jgi:hypothetical protein